jgi:hypothetical protein
MEEAPKDVDIQDIIHSFMDVQLEVRNHFFKVELDVELLQSCHHQVEEDLGQHNEEDEVKYGKKSETDAKNENIHNNDFDDSKTL